MYINVHVLYAKGIGTNLLRPTKRENLLHYFGIFY